MSHPALQSLLARARERKSQFAAEFSWYVAERLVHRLEQSGVRETMLLSGDFLIHALLPGGEEPSEWALELVWLGGWSEPAIRTAIQALAAVDLADAMEFGAGDARFWQFASLRGRLCVDVALEARLDGVACPINLTIVHAGNSLRGAEDVDVTDVLKALPGSRPIGLAPATLIADRAADLICAGIPALRPKAYLDLYVLANARVASDAAVAAALVPALGRSFWDRTHELPSAFCEEAAADKGLNDMWLAMLARRGVTAPTFSEVIEALRGRIEVWLATTLPPQVASGLVAADVRLPRTYPGSRR